MAKKSFKNAGADLFISTPASIQEVNTDKKNLKINPKFKALIPLLSKEEYAQLEENLLLNGIREPISLWGETIIDGHNRYEIAQKYGLLFTTINYDFENEDNVLLWIIKNQFGRRNISAYDRSILALNLKPIIAEKAKEQQIRKPISVVSQNSEKQKPIDTQKELAEIAGVSHDTIAKVEKIEQIATPEIKSQLKRGDISINKAYQDIKRQEKQQKIIIPQPESSDVKYDVILADWIQQYNFQEIKVLEIPAENNAVLYIWATAPKLIEALEVLHSWGFTYKSQMVWDKENIGTDHWVRGQHEILLIGVKGTFKPPASETKVSSVYKEKLTQQSKKPNYYYDLIEKMHPNCRYIELFSKEKHNEKWTIWNNQISENERNNEE